MFSEGFKRAFNRTYQSIGNDIEQVFEEFKDDYENANRDEIMAESVLDANRLRAYGGEDGLAADQELSRLVKEKGYNAVLKEATKLL